MWSGKNFTVHSLRALLRLFNPPLEGHSQSFGDTTHCATEIHKQEQQWTTGMQTDRKANGG